MSNQYRVRRPSPLKRLFPSTDHLRESGRAQSVAQHSVVGFENRRFSSNQVPTTECSATFQIPSPRIAIDNRAVSLLRANAPQYFPPIQQGSPSVEVAVEEPNTARERDRSSTRIIESRITCRRYAVKCRDSSENPFGTAIAVFVVRRDSSPSLRSYRCHWKQKPI